MRGRHQSYRRVLVLLLVLSMFMAGFAVPSPKSSVMAQTTPDPGLDQYGGWKGLQGHNTTGHWTVELIGDRYWFVSPDNNVLWICGDIGCTPGIEGLGAAVGLGYAPTGLVNQAKYSSTGAWSKRQIERSLEWSFNNALIPGGSAVMPPGISRCALLDMNWLPEEYGVPRVARFFVDVFDTRYPAACVKKAQQVRPLANDPWTIGVYLGNEQAWNGEEFSPIGLPNVFIGLPATAAGKKYWVNTFLQNRYATLEGLNTAYGTDFHSWDDVLSCTSIADRPAHPKIHEDKVDFSEDIAEAYYKPLAAAVRAVAPRLLVLSERLLPRDFMKFLDYNKRIWKVAGKYCDVFCANSYVDYVELEQTDQIISDMMKACGKPILITEHSYVANDTSLPRNGGGIGGNRVATQTDRASSYVNYLNGLLTMKVEGPSGQLVNPFLGINWYKWYDDPSLGSAGSSGENCNFGLLDGMDEAYTPLTDVMKTANSQVYDAIVHSVPIRVLSAPRTVAPTSGSTAEGRTTFSWQPVQSATSYTLLLSPERAFPDEQTIRTDGIQGTSYTPTSPLAQGNWWWCVKANDGTTGHGGYYSQANGFRVQDTSGPVDAVLNLEQLNRITFEDIWDAGGSASSFAFLDTAQKSEGTASARCVFTEWARNIVSPLGRNDASVFVDCTGAVQPWTGFSLAVRPTSCCDTTETLVPSSKYLRVRVWDGAGRLFLEWPLDPLGALPVGQWSTVTIPFGTCGPQTTSKIALTFVTDQDRLATDQRLTINIDDIVPLATADDVTAPLAPLITDLKASDSSLSVHLDATDPESGIRSAQICAGTAPGSSDLVPWTTADSDLAVSVALGVSATSSWYVSAKAQNGAGIWSSVTTVDGSHWTVSTNVTSLAEEHGSLTPAGTVLIPSGSAQTFSAAPEFGYSVRDILVDGTSIGTQPTVTVHGDGKLHSIVARFMFSNNGWSLDHLPAHAKTTLSMPIGSMTYQKNGAAMTLDVPPYISSGRTLVPVRAISEGLGADVQWDAATHVVTVNFQGLDGAHAVSMTIGAMAYSVDGKSAWMEVAPVIVGGRTFVPLRAVSEAFGAQVDWNADTRTVLVQGVNASSTPLNDGKTLKELYDAARTWDVNGNVVSDSLEPFLLQQGAQSQPACERTLKRTDVFAHTNDTTPAAELPALSTVVPTGVHNDLIKVRYSGQLSGYIATDALEQRTRDLPSLSDTEKWVPASGPSLQSSLNDAVKTQNLGFLTTGQSLRVSDGAVVGASAGEDPFGFETDKMIAVPNAPFGIRFRLTRTLNNLPSDTLDQRAGTPLNEPSVYFIGHRGTSEEWWNGFCDTEISLNACVARDGASDQNHFLSGLVLRSGQLYEIRFLDESGKTAVIALPDGTVLYTIDTSQLSWIKTGGCFPDRRLDVGLWIQGYSSMTVSDLALVVPPTAP